MNAHTPGPWMVVHELRPNDEAVADLVNNTWVIPERPVRLGSWHADAALIAAAPDLLAALQTMVDASQNDITPECDRARAAITKATGA